MPTRLDPQSMGEVLTSGGLRGLVQKAQALLAINQLLRDILSPDIAPYCSTMNLQHDTLTLQVDNAAVATHIRYSTSEILQSLHFYDKYRKIRKIICKVRPKNRNNLTY